MIGAFFVTGAGVNYMLITFERVKLQSRSIAWDLNPAINQATFDLSQHPLGLIKAQDELKAQYPDDIRIDGRFAIIDDVEAFKQKYGEPPIGQSSACTLIEITSESDSQTASATKGSFIHPSGHEIPIIFSEPPSALSFSSDVAPLDSGRKSPGSPDKKNKKGNTSPTSNSDNGLSPRKLSPRYLWGRISQGSSSSVDASPRSGPSSPRLNKSLSRRSIFSKPKKPITGPSQPIEIIEIPPMVSDTKQLYLSLSLTLPFDSIAIDNLFSETNDAPTQWGDTLSHRTHWFKKNNEALENKAARYLRSVDDIMANLGFICKKGLYSKKHILINLLSQLMDDYLNNVYQAYLNAEKPDREMQRHPYSYFRQAILDAMLDNKLVKDPGELLQLGKEEKAKRFLNNHELYLFARNKASRTRAQTKIHRLLILVSSRMSTSILSKESPIIENSISWMKQAIASNPELKSRIKSHLELIINAIIDLEKTQRKMVREMNLVSHALENNDPIIVLKQDLENPEAGEEHYHSFLFLVEGKLKEILPKNNKITEVEFNHICRKSAGEITLSIISLLHQQFKLIKPDHRYMSFLFNTDNDFYLDQLWTDQLQAMLSATRVDPKMPLKEQSRRFNEFKQTLSSTMAREIINLYDECLNLPVASSSMSK